MSLRPQTLPILLVLLLLAACSGQSSESTPPGPGPATATDADVAPTAAPTATQPAPTATALPEPTALVEASEGRVFTYYGLDPAIPIVARGPVARWDGLYINPGGMLYHDGQFHMFRNGFKDWPGLVSVGYMTSPDGLNWTEVQEQPVFTSEQVPYLSEGEGADVSSVIVLDDGTWVMYFHRVSNINGGVIGRAAAESPTGPWEVDPEPVLGPGPEGAWDTFGLEWPNVVAAEGGYVMFFGGRPDRNGERMIGRATSPDGVTWTKYDDPSTTDAPFADSDPVLVSEEAWTTGGVDRMRAQLTPEGWVMVYQGGALIKRGLAFSEDGIHWARHPDNPVLEVSDFPLSGTMWDTNMLYHDGIYYYYTEIGSMAGTDIFLAVHEGEIIPSGLDFPEADMTGESSSAVALPDGVEIFGAASLVTAPGASPIYTRHTNTNDLSLGTYTLAAGAIDTQPAHSEDEVYYILEGEGILDVDGEKIPVAAGSMVYVTAQAPHHFEDIIQDLQVLVFFSKSEPGSDDPTWLGFEVEALAADLAGEEAELPLLDTATLSSRLIGLAPEEQTILQPAGGAAAVYLAAVGDGRLQIGDSNAEIVVEGTWVVIPAGLQPGLAAGEAGVVVLEIAVVE